MASFPKSREIKLVLLGCAGVGKSSLFLRVVKDQFNPQQETTMGAAFKYVYVEEKPNGSLELTPPSTLGNLWKVGIWDTAGQERYAALGPMYYRTADVAVVVMDNTTMGIEAGKNMVQCLRREWGEFPRPICMAQNKCDVPNFVYREDIIKELNVDFACPTSAYTGENVMKMFIEACKLAVRDRKKKLALADAAKAASSSVALESTNISNMHCCY